jgi:DNA-binding NarL/FixJ family response regulator
MTKVILVEDHDLMRAYLKKFVEQVDNCKIIAEATDGHQAIEIIRSTDADLVILDLSLPRLSGQSVLESVRKMSPIKILVVTMQTDRRIIQQALDAGANGIFLKDKGVMLLEQAILETIDGKRPVYID